MERINTKLTDGSGWPKTDNLDICRQCAYQIVCHRQHAGLPTSAETDDLIDNWPGWQEIEPDDIVPQA